MITELNSKWRDIITNPEDYIDETQDLALIKMTTVSTPSNPLLLMVGYDGDSYYVVVEDNDTTEDIYPDDDETLMHVFLNVYARFVEIDTLLTAMYDRSKNANVNLVFTDENGNKVTPNANALKIFNDILEQSCLPFMSELIVDNFVLKEDVVDIDDNADAIAECLNEIFLADAMGFVYRNENGNELEMEEDGVNIMKLILKSAYIPFVAKVAAEIGYAKS